MRFTRLLSALPRYRQTRSELVDIISNIDSPHPFEHKQHHAFSGSIQFVDALIIQFLLEKYRPATILEIGSFLGFSTRWITEVSDPWQAKVTAMDPNMRHRIFDDPADTVQKLCRRYIPHRLELLRAFFCEPHYADFDYQTYEPAMDKEAVCRMVEGIPVVDEDFSDTFDLIYIDGDHSYDSAYKNTKVARKLLNPGGVILLHDTLSWPDVAQALLDLKKQYGSSMDLAFYGKLPAMVLSRLNKNPGNGIGVVRFNA